jgi:hypothetical protein
VINKGAVKILKGYKDKHNAEIGTHLHPWVNPPYEEEPSVANSLSHNLPVELQYKKMNLLTNAIADAMHEKPCTYRAGRYGFDSSTIKVLEDLNYTVDTSVVPFREAKQSFEASFGYRKSIEPYKLDYKDVMKAGQSKLLEVPLTVGFNRNVAKILEAYYNELPNIGIRRILSKVFDIDMFWLRPSYANLSQMKQLSGTFIKKGVSFLNMMFHSNELMPNGSKYCITEEDVNRYLKQLDEYFTWLNNNYTINYINLKETATLYNIS